MGLANACPLSFFNENADTFPHITRIAERVLSTPIAAAGIERAWNAGSYFYGPQSKARTSENIKRRLFLKKLYDDGVIDVKKLKPIKKRKFGGDQVKKTSSDEDDM